ncbi:MAG: hypothetical protein Q7K39_01015 [Candidatus Magasanikbacteria bacterium]|nr:hypothetical protein [Candidatus Magasanikbacteria bacterium]
MIKKNYLEWCGLFGILVWSGILMWVVFSHQNIAAINTPWQVVPSYYINIFYIYTLVIGLVVLFTRWSLPVKLVVLCLYALVVHSLLPLSHQLIYGADGWRHMASEAQILQGHWPTHPTLADGTQTGFGAGDLSYGLFWLVSAGISKLLGISLIAVTKWFQPVLFSIAFPFLLWKLTEYLGFSSRARLFTIWFSNLPFALQAAGAFSLPVNFGFLFFLGGLVILAARARGAVWATRKILFIYTAVLAVNYLLFLVLFLLAWGVLAVQNPKSKVQSLAWLIIPVALIIPALEIAAGYSHFVPVAAFSAIKQFIGNLLGWYVAAGPRPHDIATGNILFNQVPSYAFVSNLFTTWRWWLPVFALVFWGGVASGVVISWRKRENLWLAIFTLGLFISYFISRYFLTGEQVLSRRLDATLALFSVLLFALALQELFSHITKKSLLLTTHYSLLITTPLVIIASIAITASYSLGPDARAVSVDEYRAMEYVWSQEKDQDKHCVIADTYPLLALEAISGKEIIGGGFPIDANFGQSERVALFEKYSRELVIKNNTAVQLPTPQGICWFYK